MSGLEALKVWTDSGKKYALYWLFAFKRNLFDKISPMPSLRCYEDVAYIPLLIASAQKVISTDYVGYNYVCNMSGSLTNSQNIDKQRTRAYDFYYAYLYAVNSMRRLPTIPIDYLAWFDLDYHRRLASYFDSLPESLKDEFTVIYNI